MTRSTRAALLLPLLLLLPSCSGNYKSRPAQRVSGIFTAIFTRGTRADLVVSGSVSGTRDGSLSVLKSLLSPLGDPSPSLKRDIAAVELAVGLGLIPKKGIQLVDIRQKSVDGEEQPERTLICPPRLIESCATLEKNQGVELWVSPFGPIIHRVKKTN